MKQPIPRYSLRTLFAGLTVLALFIGLAANAPHVAVLSLILILPLLFIALMATLSSC
jgi:hypothetical protein